MLPIAMLLGFAFGQYASQRGYTAVGETTVKIVESFKDKNTTENLDTSYKLQNTGAGQRAYDNAQTDKDLF